LKWKKRGAKILGSFATGYSAGLSAMIPANLVFAPERIDWLIIFTIPILSGLVGAWAQFGKVLNEYGNTRSNP